jgi:hypothetical protein
VPLLPPTNNEAEREIRPAVVVRKISAGNRTLAGAEVHERLASITRTAQRNGVRLAEVLPELLCSPARRKTRARDPRNVRCLTGHARADCAAAQQPIDCCAGARIR